MTDNTDNLEIHHLPNGSRLIVEQVPLSAVSLNLWFGVGSALESDDINGMAHFLEHMVFKGSNKLKLGEFERAIESCGGNTNAATSQDFTNYFITVAPENFHRLAPLQLDVVMDTAIPEPEFQRERLVVLEEIRRSNDNPDQRIYRWVSQIAYPHLPYRRCVLGPSAVIENLQPEQMRQFHRSWYVPANMTITCVGNLPAGDMAAVIQDACAQIPSRSAPPLPHYSPEPEFTAREEHTMVDDRLQQARLILLWRVPGLDNFRDSLRLTVLSRVLGGGLTSRLVQDLRETRRLVDSISVSNWAQRWQGIFQVSAKLPIDHVPVVETAICEHLQRLQQELITESEITRIRAQVASQFVFGYESPRDRARIYGYYDRVVGNLSVSRTYPELVNAITREELQSCAQNFLSTQAYARLVASPH